jgi:hypothetical protein
VEVELMARILPLVVILAAVTLVAAARAQDSSRASPVRIVTKTLVASEAQKECFSLDDRQRLQYRFRADGPLHFKLTHQEEREVIDLKRDGADSAAGSFAPRKTADHCLVWTNAGKQSVTLRYEFRRGPK